MTYKLDFTKPMEAHNVVDFTFAPQSDGTNVTWAMRGPMPFVSEVMTLFFDMDKAVGGEFEKGLTSLKALAQKELPGALPRQQPAQGESTCA